MILLDTHPWIWFLTNPHQLPESVLTLIENERGRDGVRVSAISVWEMGMLCRKGRLTLTLSPEAFRFHAARVVW